MSGLDARLARLEHAASAGGAPACRCGSFDHGLALAALGGAPIEARRRCPRCGKPSAALAIESVDYAAEGWR